MASTSNLSGNNALSTRIQKGLSNPALLKSFIVSKLRALPFALGLNKLIPRSYFLSYVPDRYSINLDRYRSKFEKASFNPKKTRGWIKRNILNNSGDMTRYYFLNLVCDQIAQEKVDGDIAELGVYRGNSAVVLAQMARQLGKNLFLFDTFDGFDSRDLMGTDKGVSTAFTNTSLEIVKSLVGTQNVDYIKGYFPDSVTPKCQTASYCLVHLDCDLYAPTKAALDFFYPRLVKGAFLIVHDYSSLSWDGVQKAVDEFFEGKAERIIPVPDKSGSIVIRKV